MNVWNYAAGPRPKGYKPKNTSKPPRVRDGHQIAGGRPLRRAMKRLLMRQDAHSKTISSLGKGKSISPLAFRRPGSMNK